MNLESLQKRIKNPIFLLALASFIYKLTNAIGIEIDYELFMEFVDIITWLFLGLGVYKSFDAPQDSRAASSSSEK